MSDNQWDVQPGWRVPWPDPPSPEVEKARVDRVLGIVTSALTSAVVSVLVLWLWGSMSVGDPGAVTVTYQPLDAKVRPEEEGESPALSDSEPSLPGTPAAQYAAESDAVPADAGRADAGRTVTARRAASRPTASLVVLSDPPGAHVTINGIGYGTTPARIGYLPPGARRIRITKDGFAAEERFLGPESSAATTLRIVMREKVVGYGPGAGGVVRLLRY